MVWKWSPSVTWRCLCVWLPRSPTVFSHPRRASRRTWHQHLLSRFAVKTVEMGPTLIVWKIQQSSTEVQQDIINLKFLGSLQLTKNCIRRDDAFRMFCDQLIFLRLLGGGIGYVNKSWLCKGFFEILGCLGMFFFLPFFSFLATAYRILFPSQGLNPYSQYREF